MTRQLSTLLALLVALTLPALAAPPKVVKATPGNNELEVNPSLSELRIVFAQPMNPGGRSVVNSSRGVLPDFVGKPRWEDDRTFRSHYEAEGFVMDSFRGSSASRVVAAREPTAPHRAMELPHASASPSPQLGD